MRAVKTPCKACPFMATTKPGALGGSTPETFIGQVYGPFTLPCHAHCDFDDPNWKAKATTTPQCAGAAMFRKAQGISSYLPEVLPSMEPRGPLLSDPVLFYSHHKKISKAQAIESLREKPVGVLLQEQLAKQDNTYHR